MILADAIAKHKSAKLLTGTDEHGLKVYNSAIGMNINTYCNQASNHFKELADQYIKYDTFVRTTEASHIEIVKEKWNIMVRNGLIVKDVYKGYYCQSEEAFVNHKTDLYLEEDNYFFKLDQDHLAECINSAPIRYQNELKSLKMDKICVSRPKERYRWGIEVPGNESQLIYVWLDALLGYLQEEEAHYIHVIGKDIVRFHALYWPSFLKGINNHSKTELIVHNHWIKDNMKMSKSLGNVITPKKLQKNFTAQQIRLYFLTQGPQTSDKEIDNKDLIKCWNDYIDQFQNTLSRLFRPNVIKPNLLIFHPYNLDDHLQGIRHEFLKTHEKAQHLLELNQFVEAYLELQKIYALINGVLHQRAPWNQTNQEEKEKILGFLCVLISMTQYTLNVFINTPELILPQFKEFPTNSVGITVNTQLDLKLVKIKPHELNTSLY